MKNSELFSGRAENYREGRPSYPAEMLSYLYCECGFNENSVIADIGSGTGKLSKLLLERGSTVYCIEPNEDMRLVAEKELSVFDGFISVDGNAESTGLNDNSVDFITVAQAFHWFNPNTFRLECNRILKDNSKILLVWNSRDMTSPFNKESYEIYAKYCPRFKGFHGGVEVDDMRFLNFFDGEYKHIAFDNPLPINKDKFVKRSLSASYSLQGGDKGFNEYIKALEELFDNYSADGYITMDNKTDLYIGM